VGAGLGAAGFGTGTVGAGFRNWNSRRWVSELEQSALGFGTGAVGAGLGAAGFGTARLWHWSWQQLESPEIRRVLGFGTGASSCLNPKLEEC
jgi:hypothetical protein